MRVELAYRPAVVAPVAVRALENDAALLQQPLQNELDLKLLAPHVTNTESEILEIHENGDKWFI